MNLKDLNKISSAFPETAPMPVLFIGHGSPMNAIEENAYVTAWRRLGQSLPKPRAILCISAHFLTRGTLVTAMERPRTIHDFGGFPQELFQVQYPAAGSLELALETQKLLTATQVELDHEWGLDHGAWSIIKHLYPAADVPVVEMSLDYYQPLAWHYELARDLRALRRKGVLIIGSGNIVHNLRLVDFASPAGFDWAVEANEKVKQLILSGDHLPLTRYQTLGREVQMAIPTPDHFIPLLYTLGLREEGDLVSFFNDETVYGSLSMTSVQIGQ